MKKLLPILLLFCTTIAFAQTAIENDSTKHTLRKEASIDKTEIQTDPFQKSENLKSSNLDLTLPSAYESKTPTITLPPLTYNHFPLFDPNTNLQNQYAINNRSWISTSLTSTNYYGLGGVYMIGASMNRKLGNFGILTGGVYASKYNYYNTFSNSAGINGNFKIMLSDRISLNAFGQYSLSGAKNGIPPSGSTLYPTSFYGGSLEFKVTNKWGIVTGAEREFDVFSRKWVTRPFIMPIFFGHWIERCRKNRNTHIKYNPTLINSASILLQIKFHQPQRVADCIFYF